MDHSSTPMVPKSNKKEPGRWERWEDDLKEIAGSNRQQKQKTEKFGRGQGKPICYSGKLKADDDNDDYQYIF